MKWVRISKRQAKQRFMQGDVIYLCPCKCRPDGPFSMACAIHGKEWIEKAEIYRKDPKTPMGDTTAWDLMYNNWAFYNATYDTGYYAHYYIQEK